MKAKRKIEGHDGRKFPATYKGLMDALASVPASGGVVHLGKGVSIKLPEKAIQSLGIRVSKLPSES